jgi:uncharacterized protein YifE (UPF0438 family)
MPLPPEHSALLSQHDFVPEPGGDFDDKEKALLVRYGRWLEALASGVLAPITDEQKHFVQAARGESPPGSAFESAWLKHVRAAQSGAKIQIGPMETDERLARLAEAKSAAAALHAEYDSERESILAQVRTQLEALGKAYVDLLRQADEEVSKRESEVREAVLLLGQSAQHGDVQAAFCRGRVTWDSKGLERYIEQNPDAAEFRRVGSPSVRITYRKGL